MRWHCTTRNEKTSLKVSSEIAFDWAMMCKGAREGEMRVGEILDPLITLVVGYQASTDAVTIRKVGQCTTVQTRDTSETR